MKNVALAVLLVSTLVFAGLYMKESSKRIEARTSAETLQRRVAELETAATEAEQKSASLRKELDQTWQEAAAKDREIAQLKATSASSPARAQAQPPTKPANPLSNLAKVFDDPAMKEAIAAQQKAALGPMTEKNYAKLFEQLGLSPEQTAALKEMLVNKQLIAAEMGMAALSQEPGNMADLGKKVKAATDTADAEIKNFLGDEKYDQLKAYEKTVADRMALSGFKEQLSASAALSADQEQQLIAAMSQARENFKFTSNFADPSKNTGDMTAMFTEENVTRFAEEMDQLNQRFVSHAQNILTPAQLEAFQKHLNTQTALQKAGMQMGAKMFGAEKQ